MNYTDALGQVLALDRKPERIISLVPSITELLVDLGLEKQLVGITKFCVHPKQLKKTKSIIGGTKTTHIEKIKALSPDLIIANKEENVKAQVEAMRAICPVYISEVKTLQNAIDLILVLGHITHKKSEAQHLAKTIQKLRNASTHAAKSVAYIIWKEPLMSIGRDTFIHSMLDEVGFNNVFGDQLRYPTLDKKLLKNKQPDIIFLASEPYPFKEKHLEEFQEAFPQSNIKLIDGERVSWYGSRMLKGIPYLQSLAAELGIAQRS